MTKHQYLKLCMQQTPEWLRGCAATPSELMRPAHVALVRIALRRLEARK